MPVHTARPAGVPRLLGFSGVLHSRSLAFEVSQIIELGASYLRRPHDLDLLDGRRMQRENALDAVPERHLAHGERCAGSSTMLADDDPLKDLNTLFVTLAHFHVHADGVTRLHGGPFRQLCLLDPFYYVHDLPLSSYRDARRARAACAVLLHPASRPPADPADDRASARWPPPCPTA